MEENTSSKVGTFVSSAVSRILNLVMILVTIALAGIVVFFWNKNQLLEQGNSNLQDQMDRLEEMNSQAKVEDAAIKGGVEENIEIIENEAVTNDIVSNEVIDDLKTYKNEKYGYSFQYPKNAKISQPNGIEDGSCVYVEYKSGTAVFAPNPEFGCFRTGVGAYTQQSETNLTLTINGKKYNVTMQEFFMPAEDEQIVNDVVPIIDDFLILSELIKLDDGTKITFESSGEEENLNKEKYLKIRDEMIKIVETYKSLK